MPAFCVYHEDFDTGDTWINGPFDTGEAALLWAVDDATSRLEPGVTLRKDDDFVNLQAADGEYVREYTVHQMVQPC